MRRYIGKTRSWTAETLLIAALAGTLLDSTSQAQAPPRQNPGVGNAPAVVQRPKKEMGALLADWERQSALLKTLDVKIVRIDKSEKWGVDETFEGRAILKAPNLAMLHFDSVVQQPGQPKKLVPHEQIRCTGNEVWQFNFGAEIVAVFPLDKDERKRALEEGPLPFLFNMKKAEALARYEMVLVKESPEQKSYIISVTPKQTIDQESFSKAFVVLDMEFLLPKRIFLISPNGKDSKDYQLNDIKPNIKVSDANFQPVVPMKAAKVDGKVQPWKVDRNPGGDVRPAGPNNGPAVQPALRPGTRPAPR